MSKSYIYLIINRQNICMHGRIHYSEDKRLNCSLTFGLHQRNDAVRDALQHAANSQKEKKNVNTSGFFYYGSLPKLDQAIYIYIFFSCQILFEFILKLEKRFYYIYFHRIRKGKLFPANSSHYPPVLHGSRSPLKKRMLLADFLRTFAIS